MAVLSKFMKCCVSGCVRKQKQRRVRLDKVLQILCSFQISVHVNKLHCFTCLFVHYNNYAKTHPDGNVFLRTVGLLKLYNHVSCSFFCKEQ